jgi:hypothetical protein
MDRKSTWRFGTTGAGIALAALLAAACGGNGVTTPSPSPSPPDGPFNQTINGSVSMFGTTRHPLTITRSGQMTVRLSWSTSTVDLDLFLAPSTCVELYPTSACGVLAASDSATGMTEEIRRTVTAGDAFSIFVDNLSPTQPQTYTITVAIP